MSNRIRVAVIDDRPEVAAIIVKPLTEAGCEILSQLAPVDFEVIVHFGPDVVVAGVYRKRQTDDQKQAVEVVGLESLRQMAGYPLISMLPVILVGVGIEEHEIPVATKYDLFLYFPDEAADLVPKVKELAATKKSKRKISDYICPNPGCGHRLMFIQRDKDLFCLKCGTGVSMIDDEDCIWMDGEGQSHPCKVLHVTQLGAKQLG